MHFHQLVILLPPRFVIPSVVEGALDLCTNASGHSPHHEIRRTAVIPRARALLRGPKDLARTGSVRPRFSAASERFVKGHDFSRADKPRNSIDAPPRRNGPSAVSLERRMDSLAALGQDVEITVRPARRGQGAVAAARSPRMIAKLPSDLSS